MTDKSIVAVYPGCHFYLSISSFGIAYLPLRKHQEVVEVSRAPKRIVYITEENFLYMSNSKATKIDRAVNSQHHRPRVNLLDKIAKLDSVKERCEENHKNNWREDVQLPDKFKSPCQSFSVMLTALQSMCHGLLRCISVAKNLIHLHTVKIESVHYVTYRARPTSRRRFSF